MYGLAYTTPMQLSELQEKITSFVTRRDWKQFHNPKDLALSLTLEASEVMEHFQWKSPEGINQYLKKNKKAVGEELADVLYWVLLLSHYLDNDLEQSFKRKMRANEKKYPVSKVKGKHTKYTN